MDQFLDEFIVYAQEILNNETITPETKQELIESKVSSYLSSVGYSEEFIKIILDKFHVYGQLVSLRYGLPDLFKDKDRLKNEYRRYTLNSISLLEFSIKYEPTKTLEDKIRIYYHLENYPSDEIDRIIDYTLFTFNENPSVTYVKIRDMLESIEIFRLKNSIGNLLSINNALDKLNKIKLDVDNLLGPAIIEYLHAKECSDEEIKEIYPKIYGELSYKIKKYNPTITGDSIAYYIKDIINEFKIAMFLFLAQDTLENMEGQVMEFIEKYELSKRDFDQQIETIFNNKINKYIYENNNFTTSNIKEFLFNNKALSQTRFNDIITNRSIIIQPDPNINPETDESLDHDGNVLPNCAICLNILNANIPEKVEFSIKRLPCEGLFHQKCITDFQNENGQICPTCEK
jgi:hypothetical protein